jgi:phosphoadenosine phosphosulfate reductase
MLKSELRDISVMWCNTGAAYPETIKLMREVEASVPSFYEVKSNQPEFIWNMGYPVDLLPVNSTALGAMIHGVSGAKFVDYLTCCASNIWEPMHNASRQLGVTEIIRGQKLSDKRRSPIFSGQTVDGILYTFPLENMTDEDVFNYLRTEKVKAPAYYEKGEISGHDCWDCTAYLDENAKRIANLPLEKQRVVVQRISILHNAIKRDLHVMDTLSEMLCSKT